MNFEEQLRLIKLARDYVAKSDDLMASVKPSYDYNPKQRHIVLKALSKGKKHFDEIAYDKKGAGFDSLYIPANKFCEENGLGHMQTKRNHAEGVTMLYNVLANKHGLWMENISIAPTNRDSLLGLIVWTHILRELEMEEI